MWRELIVILQDTYEWHHRHDGAYAGQRSEPIAKGKLAPGPQFGSLLTVDHRRYLGHFEEYVL